MLSPDHYWRWVARPVSYYALFKWWLLLSQHPGCHGNPTTLRLRTVQGPYLTVWAVSLLTAEIIPRRLTPTTEPSGIRSLVEVGRLVAPQPHPVALPPEGVT